MRMNTEKALSGHLTRIQIGAAQARSRAARSRRATAGKACAGATPAESRAVKPAASRLSGGLHGA